MAKLKLGDVLNWLTVNARLMTRLKTIVSGILVFFAVVCLTCNSALADHVQYEPTATAYQKRQMQEIVPTIIQKGDRLPELQQLIASQQWQNVDPLIHGDLDELRSSMSEVTQLFPPKDQVQVRNTATRFFQHLDGVEQATENQDSSQAGQEYQAALEEFDTFLDYVSQS
ncbi:MAG: hypothetical protein KME06_18735 [Kastovskya adunca ATA6-11-RM4]|jgi:photosystem II protein PsbQ|nr:hypothetical protein [Kastovskya adunca ATA6-11-RM4]